MLTTSWHLPIICIGVRDFENRIEHEAHYVKERLTAFHCEPSGVSTLVGESGAAGVVTVCGRVVTVCVRVVTVCVRPRARQASEKCQRQASVFADAQALRAPRLPVPQHLSPQGACA